MEADLIDIVAGGADENRFIARKLDDVANLLEAQQADPFRVRAYREAASYVARRPRPVRDVLTESGRGGLEALPTIGGSIAAAIQELIETGHLSLIDRLRGDLDPEKVFQIVPMIGPRLAARIHDTLGLETLEGLEAAAHDGRLDAVPGIGPRRVRGIRDSLAEILSRRRPRRLGGQRPSIDDVLSVDLEYRQAAQADALPKIAPRRFNPGGEAWLPVLHTRRGKWSFTALFSNSPQAHRYGRTGDWIVIYFETADTPEGQCTVVTETRGPRAGQRVVRGYETDRSCWTSRSDMSEKERQS